MIDYPKEFRVHRHDGRDTDRIRFENLKDRSVFVSHTIIGADSATASNYGVFFIAPERCYVKSVMEVHQVAGTDGGSVGLNIEKLTDGVALGSGVEVLESDMSLKETANTTQSGIINFIRGNSSLQAGNRLAMKDTGTLTSVSNVTVLVEIIY